MVCVIWYWCHCHLDVVIVVVVVIVVERCAGAGAVLPALFSSWLWLLLMFTVVVLTVNRAGGVVVLVVFVVEWLLLWCANCDLCKKTEASSDLIKFGSWSVIKNLLTLIGHNTSAKWEAIRSETLKKTN